MRFAQDSQCRLSTRGGLPAVCLPAFKLDAEHGPETGAGCYMLIMLIA